MIIHFHVEYAKSITTLMLKPQIRAMYKSFNQAGWTLLLEPYCAMKKRLTYPEFS